MLLRQEHVLELHELCRQSEKALGQDSKSQKSMLMVVHRTIDDILNTSARARETSTIQGSEQQPSTGEEFSFNAVFPESEGVEAAVSTKNSDWFLTEAADANDQLQNESMGEKDSKNKNPSPHLKRSQQGLRPRHGDRRGNLRRSPRALAKLDFT